VILQKETQLDSASYKAGWIWAVRWGSIWVKAKAKLT